MNAPSWLILQLADSAFPVGSFAHSGGLEAAQAAGGIASGADMKAYAQDWLWQCGHAQLPWVSAAHRSPHQLRQWCDLLNAFLLNEVARQASLQQGRAFFETAVRIFPKLEALRRPDMGWHHAPIFGVLFQSLDISLDETQRLFLFASLRGWLSAAVRLNIVGTHEAQRLQVGLQPALENTWEQCRTLDVSEAAQTAPMLELFASTHDRLYSRMFLS